MQVSKWGNSLAIRLPAAVVEVLGLKEGDDIEVRVARDNAFEVARKPGSRELLERLAPVPRDVAGRFPFRSRRSQCAKRVTTARRPIAPSSTPTSRVPAVQ